MWGTFETTELEPRLKAAAEEYHDTDGKGTKARGELEEMAYGMTLVKGAFKMCRGDYKPTDCDKLKKDTEGVTKKMRAAGDGDAVDKFEAAVASGDVSQTTLVFMEEYGYERMAEDALKGDNFDEKAGVQTFLNEVQPTIMTYHYCAMSGTNKKDFPFTKVDTSKMPLFKGELPSL